MSPAPTQAFYLERVSFTSSGVLLGTAAVTPFSGIATTTTTLLPAGGHSLVAAYAGYPGVYAASKSTTLTYIITAVPGKAFVYAPNVPVGAPTPTSPSLPFSVAVGDFTGDAKASLAVANYNSSTVSVLVGNGDGTFKTKVDYLVGLHPISVVVGDFYGEGILSLAVANFGRKTPPIDS